MNLYESINTKLTEGEELKEANQMDTDYNAIINAVVKTLFPYLETFKLKEIVFDYSFKDTDPELRDKLDEQLEQDWKNIQSELSRDGLTIDRASQQIIIKSR